MVLQLETCPARVVLADTCGVIAMNYNVLLLMVDVVVDVCSVSQFPLTADWMELWGFGGRGTYYSITGCKRFRKRDPSEGPLQPFLKENKGSIQGSATRTG